MNAAAPRARTSRPDGSSPKPEVLAGGADGQAGNDRGATSELGVRTFAVRPHPNLEHPLCRPGGPAKPRKFAGAS
jgi:hypothetical protein